MQWTDRADALLYDGEVLEDRFDVGAGELVVTSHRVLAFTPDRDGANYQFVDRPNVEGVALTTVGNVAHLRRASKPAAVGVGLLSFAAVFSADAVLPDIGTAGVESGTPGTAGVADALATVERLLVLFDLAILLGGLSLAAVAVALVGLYVRSRTRLLVVEVAGDDDLEFPIDERAAAVASDLEAAIGSVPRSSGDSDGDGVVSRRAG